MMPTKTVCLMHWRGVIAFGLMALLTISAFSHDTWLSPTRSSVPVGAVISLDLTSGMAFPQLETAIKGERIEQASFRLGGKVAEITERRAASKALRLSARLNESA